jgi:hypothetical protein
MPYIPPVTSPNIEKLMTYLNKSQWHNVSAHFASYVRKEYESFMEKLDDDEEVFRNLRLMIEYSEMGRFSEAKNLIDVAYKEHQHMIARLTELNHNKVYLPITMFKQYNMCVNFYINFIIANSCLYTTKAL